MKELRLLIVEDDTNVIETYTRDINSYNKTNENIKIIETILSDKDKALELLRNSDNIFDGAIIDLDLKQSGGSDSSGNEIIELVKNNLRFPVFVISGTPQNVDSRHGKESTFFKVRSRDDEFQFIEEFVDIYNTGITEILNRKGTIEEYINTIFWDHLSNSLDLWTNDRKRSPEEKQKSLLRYTLLHLQEYLEITVDSEFENYLPSEIYITPVIKPSVFTGDIVQNNEDKLNYVVLTPSCDLAQSKAKDILLVAIEPIKDTIVGEKIGILKKGQAKKEQLEDSEKILRKIIHNTFSNKYHFLPKYKNLDGGLINFQKLHSLRIKDFDNNYTRIASINGSFTKDVVARFSYYYSRQGSPDFESDELYNSLFS